jgi:hypothetical protein
LPYNSFPRAIFNTRHLASRTSLCFLTQADFNAWGTQQITLFCSDQLTYGFTLTDRWNILLLSILKLFLTISNCASKSDSFHRLKWKL